ncbi:MAG: AmmeMemoRadiSam system protein B, partial [archaeon]|nr:AmmeMemoRadiSam system protein B [archaeon]
MIVRKASHAGSWYDSSEKSLRKSLDEFFSDNKFGPGELLKSQHQENRTILGGISPHAGLRYSGCCSAWTYLNLFKEKLPDTVIVLGTDHIGYGKVALMEEGQWETPLGNLTIDSELSREILNNSNIIIGDNSAFTGHFEREHNIEIQLPFIKYCARDGDVKILPIKVSTKKFSIINELSSDIANAIKNLGKDIVIVASSDMTHKQPMNYMNPEKDLEDMYERDQAVIDAFKEFNPELTY